MKGKSISILLIILTVLLLYFGFSTEENYGFYLALAGIILLGYTIIRIFKIKPLGPKE